MKKAEYEPHLIKSEPGFQVTDYLVILFRHKGKILLSTAIGLVAAVTFYLLSGTPYESQAKLLVRYVVERSAFDPGNETAARPVRKNEHVIDAEIQILTSEDLAKVVVENVGIETLVESDDANAAAAAITLQKNLMVKSTSKGSNVILVSYQNRDPQLAVLVLQELIKSYFAKHLEIHRSSSGLDDLSQQADKVRTQLRLTEDSLNKIKSESGILSLSDSTESLNSQMTKVEEDLNTTHAELVEQAALVEVLEKQPFGLEVPTDSRNAKETQEYQTLIDFLSQLRLKKLEFLANYHPKSQLVSSVQEQIAETESELHDLAERFPGIATRVVPTSSSSVELESNPLIERSRLAAIQARKEFLETLRNGFAERITRMGLSGNEIVKLERKKATEEGKLQMIESRLDQAEVDRALRTLNSSAIPNIGVVQQPSVPMRFESKTEKIALGIVGFGAAVGIGLAFLIELFLDRTIKRREDIEVHGTPLILSIPQLDTGNRPLLALPSGKKKGKKVRADTQSAGKVPTPCPWEGDHFIRPYTDAIRDRLGYYFEINEVKHKPKLIGVTGFSKGVGASTLAAGLAASCSEPGYGKVLLVDMNGVQAETHSFFEGKPVCTLPEALRSGEDVNIRFKAVQKYLFLASAASKKNGTDRLMTRDFYDLMPQLKLSDFDYIIFDMPPIDALSPTLSMAGFMDKMLVIAEARSTDRDVLKRSYSELVESNANASFVLNKLEPTTGLSFLSDA